MMMGDNNTLTCLMLDSVSRPALLLPCRHVQNSATHRNRHFLVRVRQKHSGLKGGVSLQGVVEDLFWRGNGFCVFPLFPRSAFIRATATHKTCNIPQIQLRVWDGFLFSSCRSLVFL